MRRPGVKSVFYMAIVVAAIATVGAYRALQATRVGDAEATRTVVVATRDIPEGATVERAAIKTARWPSENLPAGAITSPDSVLGRVTRVPIFTGDPLTAARLAPTGSGPGLEVKIMPGKRAMGVKIDDVAGISGLVQPNSRVDVLVTLRPDNSSQRQVAKLFMENLRVLSIGAKMQRGDDGKPITATTATLEVTPAEAERLAVAMNQGSIQLVLRGYGDPDSVRTPGANTADILSQLRDAPARVAAQDPPARPRPRARAPEPEHKVTVTGEVAKPVPPPPAPKPESTVIHVYRGAKVEQQKVGRDSSRIRPRQQ